jgi:hypothetical protein
MQKGQLHALVVQQQGDWMGVKPGTEVTVQKKIPNANFTSRRRLKAHHFYT